MRKYGYAATDYLIISAVILAAVIPFFFIAHEPLRSTPQSNMQDAFDSVAIAAQRLNRLAEDSADRVVVVIPKGVEGDPVISKEGVLRLRIGGQEYPYVFHNVVGRFPTNRGRQFVYLRKIRDKVHIYPAPLCGDGRIEGLEQCDPPSSAPTPSCPEGCNARCRCICTSNAGCTGQNSGYICKGEECTPCIDDRDCMAGEVCINGRCTIPPEPTQNCCLPNVVCPLGKECDRETCTCVPSTIICPPPGAECSVACPCANPRERCSAGSCVPACEVSGCIPPAPYCNPDPLSGTYGECVNCSPTGPRSQRDCNYPFGICDIYAPTGPTHLNCIPCSEDAQCVTSAERCLGTLLPGNGVCGKCETNSDCGDPQNPGPAYPDAICDPIYRTCKPCYWAFGQCDAGDVCIQGQCLPVRPPYNEKRGCGYMQDGTQNPYWSGPLPPQSGSNLFCDSTQCPGAHVCTADTPGAASKGCVCKPLPRWFPPYVGTTPRPDRPPGGRFPVPMITVLQAPPWSPPTWIEGPAIGLGTGRESIPPVSGLPSSGCVYNPWKTVPEGSTTGGDACTNLEPDGWCLRTGPTTCTWIAPGQIPPQVDYFLGAEFSGYARVAESHNWNIPSAIITPRPGGTE